MSKNKQINHKGFTLLEILLVIGIIGILAAIVIIAINPGRSLAKSRDLQRKVGITEINKALSQYYIDNNQYPSTVTPYLTSICPTGSSATSSGFNCGDLGLIDLSMLVPTYLPSIPVDPTGVGYKIGLNTSRRIMLVANLTETVSSLIAIGTTTSYVVDTNPSITLGDGSAGNPYQISNWSQLNHIRDDLTKNYTLTTNLSASTYGYAGVGDGWVPIGSTGNPFTGNFDGGGNTISDLIADLNDYSGLFGYINGNISNINLTNVNITGSNYVGGLAGYSGGTISNSSVSGIIGLAEETSYSGSIAGYSVGNIINCSSAGTISGWNDIGGITGYSTGVVSNSYSSGNIFGRTSIAGLVGVNKGSISNSHATGNVTTAGNSNYDDYSGGLVGYSSGSISNSYSTGNVHGFFIVGGFVGEVDGGTISNSYSLGNISLEPGFYGNYGGFVGDYEYGSISNSYSTGSIPGSYSCCGFIGHYNTGDVTLSYWDQTTSNKDTSAGSATGTTTIGMKTASLYTGWSDSIWNIADGSYPTLK